jgi:hypothetical protein
MLPSTESSLARGRAGLVLATSLAVSGAIVFLILAWLISGDLQWQTVVAGAVFVALLAGVAGLARAGRTTTATWTLVGLLTLVITADVVPFGVGSLAAAGYVIPIVIAACGLGLGAGLGVAAFGAAVAWMVAGTTTAGWYQPLVPLEISHLTFNAPVLTAIFGTVALVTGLWTRYLSKALEQANDHDDS